MTLKPLVDVSVARWLTTSTLPWQRLVTFGPSGFDDYARLRFLADPAHEGQSEAEAAPPSPPWDEQLSMVLTSLAPYTRTPEQCYFCVWEGWGDARGAGLAVPMVEVPNRSYLLLQGAVGDVDDWGAATATVGLDRTWEPAFVWPADQSWCLANDVDPHWAGIGASHLAMQSLLADPRIDVVLADPDDEQPAYR